MTVIVDRWNYRTGRYEGIELHCIDPVSGNVLKYVEASTAPGMFGIGGGYASDPDFLPGPDDVVVGGD